MCIYIYKNLYYFFSIYKEQLNKQMENINRKNYIDNQLKFEKESENDKRAEFKGKFANRIC